MIETVYDLRDVALGIDRAKYLKSIGFEPYEWQVAVCHDSSTKIIVNGARQSGKSTISSGLPCHMAKYKSKSLVIIEAPTEVQAGLNMEKIFDFMAHDRKYPKIERKSDSQILLANGSRIRVVCATDRSSRGYSAPDMIVLDEASRIEDVVYRSGVRPMLTNNASCELILISTPFGKDGFFYNAWNSDSEYWSKYEVRSPWTPDPVQQSKLTKHEPDEAFFTSRKKDKIKFYYSPRHNDFDEQQENLHEMGYQQYMQEYCCEFVETEHAAFSYQDIDTMFSAPFEEEEPLLVPEESFDEIKFKKIGGKYF